eukprot:GHVH01003856.1.p1 GENE.GHVH01003856.1~~GHVH01003856.1.p1  ORF type:complete len:456 (+),score=124.97 GHVH01003856.1:98-1465(+)
MSFIGFKVEVNDAKGLSGLAEEGYLIHLTKAVLVTDSDKTCKLIVQEEDGTKTIVALLDGQNRMVTLDLIFDQTGNSIVVECDGLGTSEKLQVHVSGYSEPSGDIMMNGDDESMSSGELRELEAEQSSSSDDHPRPEPYGVDLQAKDDAPSSSSDVEDNDMSKVKLSGPSVMFSSSSSSDEEDADVTAALEKASAMEDSISGSNDDSSEDEEKVKESSEDDDKVKSGTSSSGEASSDDSDNVTDEDIKKMLAALDIDEELSDSDSDAPPAKASKKPSSSKDDDSSSQEDFAGRTDGSSPSTEANSEETVKDASEDLNAKKKAKKSDSKKSDSKKSDSKKSDSKKSEAKKSEAKKSDSKKSDSKKRSRVVEASSEETSADTTSTPPAKKSKVSASADPEIQFEGELTKFLSSNGRTPLPILGAKIKKPAGVKGKLGIFIKSRPDKFIVKGDQVELK